MPENTETTSSAGASPAVADALVSIRGLSSGYGGVPVLHDLTFDVGNEVFTILGANGAGKTTLLATLARLLPTMSGSITVNGTDTTTMAPADSARLELATCLKRLPSSQTCQLSRT